MKFQTGDTVADIAERSTGVLADNVLILQERGRLDGLAFERATQFEGTHLPREAPAHCSIHSIRIAGNLWKTRSGIIGDGCYQLRNKRRFTPARLCQSLQPGRKDLNVGSHLKGRETDIAAGPVLKRIDIERQNSVAFLLKEAASCLRAKHLPLGHEAHEIRHAENVPLRVLLCILVDVIGNVKKHVQADNIDRAERSRLRSPDQWASQPIYFFDGETASLHQLNRF